MLKNGVVRFMSQPNKGTHIFPKHEVTLYHNRFSFIYNSRKLREKLTNEAKHKQEITERLFLCSHDMMASLKTWCFVSVSNKYMYY